MGKNVLSGSKTETQKRKKGIATIKVVGEKCRVTFDDDAVEFDNGKNSKSFELDEMPKYPKLPEGSKSYFVVLNQDADTVESIGPVEGVFPAHLVDFNRQDEDSDPAPLEKESTNEKWPPYQYFLAFFEITGGPYKKVKIPYFLHYKFEESSENPGETGWKGNPENRKATRLHQLIEFCEKLDLTDEPIKWPDDGNILPTLLERAEENPKSVKIVVKNGYIDSLLGDSSEEAEDEDEPTKAKAPVKKHAPKHDEDEDL